MQHLKTLKYLTYAYAAFTFLSGLSVAIAMLVYVGAGLIQAFLAVGAAPAEFKQEMLASGISLAVQPVCPFLALAVGFFVVTGLAYLAGNKLGQGSGRLLQTAVALFAVSFGCIGVLYAGYALWVCWINAETANFLGSGQSEECPE